MINCSSGYSSEESQLMRSYNANTLLRYLPEVTEGEAFHDFTALMMNVKAKSNNAVAMPVLNTSNSLIIFKIFGRASYHLPDLDSTKEKETQGPVFFKSNDSLDSDLSSESG